MIRLNDDLYVYLNTSDWEGRLPAELAAIERVIELQRGKGTLRVLDVGCGPGIHLKALAKKYPHHRFDGIDIDPTRIEHARAEANKENLPITYVTGDFMKNARLPRPTYDIVYAIGNSIALIWGCGNVGAVIEKVAGLLEPGGHFLFQIQNNDNPKTGITASRIVSLPDGGDCFTAKRYEPDRDVRVMRIEFITFTRAGGSTRYAVRVDRYSWHLIPWTEIATLLGSHGFTLVDAWGDYGGSPFVPATSKDLVVLAKKPLNAAILCDGKGMRVPGNWY